MKLIVSTEAQCPAGPIGRTELAAFVATKAARVGGRRPAGAYRCCGLCFFAESLIVRVKGLDARDHFVEIFPQLRQLLCEIRKACSGRRPRAGMSLPDLVVHRRPVAVGRISQPRKYTM